MEAWATIRHLHAQGHSVRRIARDLHLSRQAVRRCTGFREMLRVQGRRVNQRALDLMIAATALEHDLVL